MERSSRGLIYGIILATAWRNRGIPRKILKSVQRGYRAEELTNTKQDCQPFGPKSSRIRSRTANHSAAYSDDSEEKKVVWRTGGSDRDSHHTHFHIKNQTNRADGLQKHKTLLLLRHRLPRTRGHPTV